ncbi:uncharacterized protein LOC101848009 [Aplysia californica]|uniref:Uncharacterized protein LOC101848009 n=1 Tax=Aplysia californica TaxID=6500 RepID=A0ABM0K8T2_APLCA|nr:uncharacterized protein LOC101848009 [Aplysia californica]
MPLPDSEAFNLRFVQLVETYKCLYDTTLPDYTSKDVQDKAWEVIATKCRASVLECKLRWKHLRGGLTRYIKNVKRRSSQRAKPIKQFYLWDVMQFVLPFVKSRSDPESSLPFCLKQEEEDPDEIEGDLLSDDEVDDTYGNNIETPVEEEAALETFCELEPVPTACFKRGSRKRLKTLTAGDSFEMVANPDFARSTPVEKAENFDLDFFKSILPDMAELNASQKRRFKVRVLQLLEEFSCEGTAHVPSSPVIEVRSLEKSSE